MKQNSKRVIIAKEQIDKLATYILGVPMCPHGLWISESPCLKCEEAYAEEAIELSIDRDDTGHTDVCLEENKRDFLHAYRELLIADRKIAKIFAKHEELLCAKGKDFR